MKDMGEISEVIGLEIQRNREKGAIFLHQKRYTEKVLERFGTSDCRPASTSIESPSELNLKNESSEPAGEIQYKRAVGNFM